MPDSSSGLLWILEDSSYIFILWLSFLESFLNK